MSRPGPAVLNAVKVIRANVLSESELELQLMALWKSGYQAGRKANLVAKGVESLSRMRAETLREIPSSTRISIAKK